MADTSHYASDDDLASEGTNLHWAVSLQHAMRWTTVVGPILVSIFRTQSHFGKLVFEIQGTVRATLRHISSVHYP